MAAKSARLPDALRQILKAKETDQRAALFAKAIKSGHNMQAANRKLLLRMRLYVLFLSLSLTSRSDPPTSLPASL